MATFVLVHGAGAGGWMWQEVDALLRRAGHEVYRPTLTGGGERAHLLGRDTGLDTHVQDIVNVFRYERLSEAVLVGHSYAGLVITGVAECVPEQISQMVYLDALVPRDGETGAGIYGPEITAQLLALVNAAGEGWYVPQIEPRDPRMSPFPLLAMQQAVAVCNPVAARLPHTYIYCTADKESAQLDPGLVGIIKSAHRARELGWRYYEFGAPHEAMVTAPGMLSDLLLSFAG